MAAEVIESIVDDIVNRLLDKISYLSPAYGAVCKKVADPRLLYSMENVPAPFALVQYAGERGRDVENMGAPPVIQQEDMRFQVWCGATSFSSSGEGTDNVAGRVGLNALIDAVWFALSGFSVPSAPVNAGSALKIFHIENTAPIDVSDSRVVSISMWGGYIVRQGGTVTS